MFTDPIADMASRMRNVQMRGRQKVLVPHSLIKERILDVLLREGYISEYTVSGQGTEKALNVRLKYSSRSQPAIRAIKRISKPSLHVYASLMRLRRAASQMATEVLSTSRGVVSGREALEMGIGGKVLLEVK
jgi:small subunit ribosomal protein S8